MNGMAGMLRGVHAALWLLRWLERETPTNAHGGQLCAPQHPPPPTVCAFPSASFNPCWKHKEDMHAVIAIARISKPHLPAACWWCASTNICQRLPPTITPVVTNTHTRFIAKRVSARVALVRPAARSVRHVSSHTDWALRMDAA
jgi:hypothetical protein